MAARVGLALSDRSRLSLAAQEAVLRTAAFQAAGSVLLYAPIRGEVETELLARAALAAGKRLVLPRVHQEPKGLVLHAYSGDPATLVKGAYGIREPAADWPEVGLAAVDLVVVPGVAFDGHGNRLGYGGGYYDRFLPEVRKANPKVSLVGLAYGFQVVESLPAEAHDIPMDGLATEAGYQATRRGQ